MDHQNFNYGNHPEFLGLYKILQRCLFRLIKLLLGKTTTIKGYYHIEEVQYQQTFHSVHTR